MRRARKAATAISFAALRMAGRAPPASSAWRARASAGKRAADTQLGRPPRLLAGDGAHLVGRPVAKGPAARGQDDAADALDPRRIEALEDRVVLGIGRQQGRAVPRRGGKDDIARRNQ